jgi:hypothetical protein
VLARCRGPHARDASFGPQRVGRAAEEQQEIAPCLDIAAREHGYRADHVAVQQLCELCY